MKDTTMGDARFVQDTATGVVFIRIAIPDLKVQKCLQFQLEHTVWQAKQRVLASFSKDLRDPLNYGLYLPPANGRAGKFMEEERLLSEYPIQGPIGFLEFKYKRRVYKMMLINERKLKQIHSKTKLKTFMELVRNGNTPKINKLTLKGLDPNFHDQDNGETPLTVAVTLGRSKCREVIINLVSGGAHLDYRNRQGMTALHRAAIVGNAEAIRTMLDLGASPNCKDTRDLTPLYYSVSNDDALQDCTYMLLHERARIGVCDEQGWYEIHQACKYGRVQHLEHLVFYGADMDVRNSCGNTPLHICALNNQEACTRLLLFRGADVTLCNYNNQTADQVAALAGNSKIAAMINAHNPDDVVPYREIPQYSDRRKGASLTPSLRALLRSRSDPRINVAGLDSRSTSAASSPFGGVVRRHHLGADSDSACSISVASSGSVTGVTDHGMYEGRTMTGREGYFPGGHLSEVNIRRAGSMGDVNIVTRATNQRNTLAPLVNVKSDDSDDDIKKKGQSRSAPNSSRKKKEKERSVPVKKTLSKSLFDVRKSSVSAPIHNHTNDNTTKHDHEGPLSSTIIGISSPNNDHDIVNIYKKAHQEHLRPSDADITVNRSNMLGSNNHDHEILPPSATNSSNKKNAGYPSNSLLRSKSLFSSTPSLFTRSTPEEKFWKNEIKREKEEKKRLEEERKRLEKLEKQEEKKRMKADRKSATVTAKNIPKSWDYVPRNIEHVYMRPALRMSTVHIDYTDVPHSPPAYHPPPPPPTHAGHYAIPHVALRFPYGNMAASADMARVEQLYGTTQRRPHGVPVHSHYMVPFGYPESRNQQPRVVMLHRSSEGYGFVLRGAKSKLPTGGSFNDFTPSAEYPALQYLDSVDPGSQADRAGLRAGDFILEINGENVVRASHERVVHLIRSSSDVLTLKVVTVVHTDPTPSDWHAYPDSGSMTLPSRKKIAAPLPPQRDPQTSLSYSKASSKSMAEGLAEIEKLDATIAEFEGQEAARSRSFHALHAADEQKVASVRASHALKRVSVMDYEGLMAGDPETAEMNDNQVSKGHISAAEARIQKYHKRSPSQTIERSKSTPDISAAVDEQYNEYSRENTVTGSWKKSHAPSPPSGAQYNTSTSATPNMAHRVPPTPEIVRINTAGRNNTYGVLPADLDNRKKTESLYDSSFRPENNASSIDSSKGIAANTNHSVLIKNSYSNHNGDKGISFADERVAENANKFIQKYPNATLLVTADVHSDKIDGKKDKVLYEPEPDYDDTDEDKSAFAKANKFGNSTTVAVTSSRLARANDDLRNTDVVRQNKSSVTVISITSGGNKDGSRHISSSHSSPHLTNSSKSSPVSARMHENTALTSPAQSISSSRRSSGVVMTTPSQPSSVESSRRSSIQSNFSGENEKNGRSCTPSSTSTVTLENSRNVESDPPPPPPPPPPLGLVIARTLSSTESGATSTLRRRPNDADAFAILQNRVSTDDILAAVAERKNRLQTEGPRLSEVKTLPMSKSTHELNQEALKAAVAKRKSRLEQVEDSSVVSEIEARLNRNKKLQAAKYFGSDTNRSDGPAKKEEMVSPPPVSAPVITAAEQPAGNISVKTKDVAAKSEPQSKVVSPNVNIKSYQNTDKSLAEKQPSQASSSLPAKSIIDFRSVLKPVDVKSTAPVAVQSKASVTSSSEVAASSASKTNVTTIVMTKTNSGKVQAPPPPPPAPAVPSAAVTTSSTPARSTTGLPALVTSKPGQKVGETNSSVTSPLSPTSASASASPSTNKTSSPADYIALAERARQEYLKKKASGNLQAHIEKKGPVEITPNKKNSQRNKPTLPASPTSAPAELSSKPSESNISEGKLESGIKSGQVSVQDRIKGLQPEKNLTNGKASVAGVTEDHSYTDVSLTNGTLRKSPPKNSALSPLNMAPATSPGFGDNDGNSSTTKAIVIDIISPPSSFNTAGSPDSALSVPSFGQDDAASFVSSASSLSTWSSEHGDGIHYSKPRDNIKDLIAHSPPPPPDFGDYSLGDQDSFIPPPPEFLEIDSNANETKTMDKNSKPFTTKPVSDWSCMDVLDWLDSLNLPQYRISFAKAQINGSKLMNMGRNEFINLGVTQVGHRMNLERSVKKLNIGISTNL